MLYSFWASFGLSIISLLKSEPDTINAALLLNKQHNKSLQPIAYSPLRFLAATAELGRSTAARGFKAAIILSMRILMFGHNIGIVVLGLCCSGCLQKQIALPPAKTLPVSTSHTATKLTRSVKPVSFTSKPYLGKIPLVEGYNSYDEGEAMAWQELSTQLNMRPKAISITIQCLYSNPGPNRGGYPISTVQYTAYNRQMRELEYRIRSGGYKEKPFQWEIYTYENVTEHMIHGIAKRKGNRGHLRSSYGVKAKISHQTTVSKRQ